MSQNLLKDLTHCVRMFRKDPGFVVAAVAALALGIGANTAIFSVINSVILRPLAYPDPDRLVQFITVKKDGPDNLGTVPEFRVLKEQKDVFQDVSAYDFSGPALSLTGGASPELIKGKHVTANFFRLFGAPVILGRTFTDEEDQPNGGYPVVLTEGLWKRRFGSDPKIIGKQISLGSQPYTVIGVVSSKFKFDPAADVFIPYQLDLNTTSLANDSYISGRLRPNITMASGQARARLLTEELRRLVPGLIDNSQQYLGILSYKEGVVGEVRSTLLLLSAAVGLVLLIACANVANLLLVRSAGRKREIAIRTAIGATRGRIIRQLLTESVLLSFAGGVVGSLLGWLGMHALLALNPGDIPRLGEHGEGVAIDWHVLAFTLMISVGTGIVFGLLPAWQASRTDLSSTLKESSSRSGTGHRQNRLRSILVISEMALAVVLLIGAALLIRTSMALRAVNPGFSSHNVLTMQMSVQGTRFEKTSSLGEMVHHTSEQLESIPGVVQASTSCAVPLEGGFGLPFIITGRPLKGHSHGSAGWTSVSPHYFDALRIPLLKGRAFTYNDDTASLPVVIINAAMAAKYWPNSNPVGQQIVIGKYVGPEFADSPRVIVGVTGGVHDYGLDQKIPPMMYLPVGQVPDAETSLNARISPMSWIIHTRGNPHAMEQVLQSRLITASGGLPVGEIRTMDEVLAQSTARKDFNMLLLTIFGGSAVLLAAIGISAVMAYSVEQRTQEIGVRIALGALLSDVRKMILLQGMRLALAGVVIGLGAAFALSRSLSSFLFGVHKWDPVVFVSVPVFLSLVALGAVWLAASRATKVNPVIALRHE